MALEYQKQELTFQVNDFSMPKVNSNYIAWSDLIIKLAMFEPGTFPDLPEAGLGINRAQYQDLDSYAARLKSNLENQISKYLPDIPVSNLDVFGTETEHGTLLVIGVEFTADETTKTVYLKGSRGSSDKMFNFEIDF